MRQRGAGYAPLPRETITQDFELICDIGRVRSNKLILASHSEDQRWGPQNLRRPLLFLNLRCHRKHHPRQPQYRRRRKLPRRPSHKGGEGLDAPQVVRRINYRGAPRRTIYPRTTDLESRAAAKEEELVRHGHTVTFWMNTLLIQSKILLARLQISLLAKPRKPKMET